MEKALVLRCGPDEIAILHKNSGWRTLVPE